MAEVRVATAVAVVLFTQFPAPLGKLNRTDSGDWPDDNGFEVPGFPCKAPGNSERVGDVYGDLIKEWKLSIPEGCGKKTCSIKSSKLLKYKDDFFYYHPGRNTVVFCTPSKGATTSKGAGVRVEMRTPYWKLHEHDRHTLTAHLKVHKIAGLKATIGQIHGDKNMPKEDATPLKIQVERDGKLRAACQVKGGKGEKVYFGSYKFGDEIRYEAVLKGTELTVTMNGITKKCDFGYLSSKTIKKGGWAFKLGTYSDTPRVNPIDPGCLVEFADFNVKHEQLKQGAWSEYAVSAQCNATTNLNCESDGDYFEDEPQDQSSMSMKSPGAASVLQRPSESMTKTGKRIGSSNRDSRRSFLATSLMQFAQGDSTIKYTKKHGTFEGDQITKSSFNMSVHADL